MSTGFANMDLVEDTFSPGYFPTPSVFTDMDYLFWRLPKDCDFSSFPWILWYIWKNKNNKIYVDKNGNPKEILRIAEVEGVVWADAQLTVPERHQSTLISSDWLSSAQSRVCFVDGAWRAHDKFSRQGWFCRTNCSDEKTMGAMNIRRILSALHA